MRLTLSPHNRDLLHVLSAKELCLLERSLCTTETDPCDLATPPARGAAVARVEPSAPWGLLEVTPPLPRCMTRLGPPGVGDDAGTNWQWRCVAAREQGQDSSSLPSGMGFLIPPLG